MQNLIHGLGDLGNGPAIAYLFGGALIGMIIGVIPGLSTVVILSIILVFVYHINLTGSLCLFLGAQCGSFYSASVSAILLNTPGHPEAFPVTLDGYPMARKGQPGRALGLSAASTCIGGLIGCGVLIAFLQIINGLPDTFHPPEYLSLVTLAMLLVGTLGANSVGKAIVSAGAGLMLASVGPAAVGGVFRFTFGATGLLSGISLVALALGVFAIPQMAMVFGTGTATARQSMTGEEMESVEMVELKHGYVRELFGGVIETFRHWGVLIQSGLVGGLTGIVPGIGGFTGNFLAYGFARQVSARSKRAQFGTGIPEGIIAPEGSSLAKEAGHIIPIIALGIPGGVAGALFIGVLGIKGVMVGYGFQTANPNVTGQIVWIIALSGIIGTVAGVLIGPQIARVTNVPGPLIVPFIFALSVSGPFLTEVQFFSVIELLVFGIVGLALRRLRFPLGSFILGLVLGPTFETNVYLTHTVYPGFSFITKRPIADVIFFIAIVVLVSKSLELHREAQKAKAARAEELASAVDETARAEVVHLQHRRAAPYPLLAPIVSVALLGVALYAIIFAFAKYDFRTGAMPVIGGLCVAIPAACFLPRDIYRYRLYRKTKAQVAALALSVQQSPSLALAGVGPTEGLATDAIATANVVEAAESLNAGLASSPTGVAAIVDKSWGPNGQYRREFIAFAWMFVLVTLCWVFGFPAGTTIFMVCYGMTSTRRYLRKVHQRVIYTVVSAGLIWLATYEMFNLTHLIYTPKINF